MTASFVTSSVDSEIRLDKWLWFARFLKSRTSASKLCLAGKVRINSQRTLKAHSLIRVGDILTFPQGNSVRVVKVVDVGRRRGPASEAQQLYQDLTKPSTESEASVTLRNKKVQGRPTKKNRRNLERFRNTRT